MSLEPLIDLFHKDKQHWLTVPRFAVVALPLMLAGILSSAGYGVYIVAPIALSALGVSRLIWFRLLPHETSRLTSARQALAAARPDEAVRILQLPIRLAGMHYKLQRADLLSKAYVRDGQFMEAHRILNTIDEKSLLSNEFIQLRCAWSQLFLAAGNTDEAARRIDGITASDCIDNAEYLLTKAQVEQEAGHLAEARKLLEAGLDRDPKDCLRILLLNNLAAVEGLQGRTDMQLRYLQVAFSIFRNAPRADLTDILHHNLAVTLARAGRSDAAREVLREAWTDGDNTNFRHVLEVLNNNLHAAREVGDQNWKNQVYEEFDRQLARFDTISPREQLALDVAQLRMRRNDGIPLKTNDYAALIKRLLDHLGRPHLTIPESDRVAALNAIYHDLNREIEAQLASRQTPTLVQLLRCASEQLLDKRAIVDAHLSTLSPKLTGPLDTWHQYQTSIDKAEILLAPNEEALRSALDQLFKHLSEKAEWLTEQGFSSQSIEAWVVLCDEYLAYQNQLPAHIQSDWRKRYLHLAEHALDQAIKLLDSTQTQQRHVDYLIGVAYLVLQFRNDISTAVRYITIVKKINPALDHFAIWLRDRYQWVLQRVGPQPAWD